MKSKLLACMKLREMLYQRDKLKLSYLCLQVKGKEFDADRVFVLFRCLNIWMWCLLRKKGKKSVIIHGEAEDLSSTQKAQNLAIFKV